MTTRDRSAVRPAFRPRPGWSAASPYSDVVQRDGDGELTASGRALRLPPRQSDLLLLLLRHPGRLITPDELSAHAWGESVASRDAVASVVKRIRVRLREVGVDDACLTTVRGLGYRWDEPDHVSHELTRAS
jgi:two-component system response regulator RegX3